MQSADGGFARQGATTSDLETTYQVMRAFRMLKAQADDAKVRSFVRKCRNVDGGYGA